MSRITLIRPAALMTRAEVPMLMPPIGVAYIAGAITAQGYACTVVDAVGEALDQVNALPDEGYFSYGLTTEETIARIPEDTALIGVSCAYTKEWVYHKLLMQEIKRRFPAVPIVCGGEHITAVPEFSLQESPDMDYCVLGEGEHIMVALIRELEKSRQLHTVDGLAYRVGDAIRVNARYPRIQDVDSLPRPNWDLIPLQNYFDHGKSFGVARGRSMPILGTRGCPHQCTFCSSATMWAHRWVPRAHDQIIAEMKDYIAKYGVSNFDFYDLTTIVRKDWIIGLARAIMDNGLDITWQLPSGTRSEAFDAEVCKALYESKCRNISFSPENAAPAVLEKMKKRLNLARLTQAIKHALRAGLNVKVNLIFGFPGERHRDVWINLAYILRLSFIGTHDLSIWSFAPYPGSEVFAALRQSGRIRDFNKDYLDSLTYGEMTQTMAWNDRMGIRWVNFYRWVGVLMFYITSALFRPHRIVKTLLNIRKGKYESRADYMVAEYFKSRRKRKAKKSDPKVQA